LQKLRGRFFLRDEEGWWVRSIAFDWGISDGPGVLVAREFSSPEKEDRVGGTILRAEVRPIMVQD